MKRPVKIGCRVENMTIEELEGELRENEVMIDSIRDTNRAIENELYWRKTEVISRQINPSVNTD